MGMKKFNKNDRGNIYLLEKDQTMEKYKETEYIIATKVAEKEKKKGKKFEAVGTQQKRSKLRNYHKYPY